MNRETRTLGDLLESPDHWQAVADFVDTGLAEKGSNNL